MVAFNEWFSVGGEIVPATESQVRGIAVHAKRVAFCKEEASNAESVTEITVNKPCICAVCFFCKCANFMVREVWLSAAAERHVKITFSVHAEQAVKTVSVEVQKHCGQSQFTAVACFCFAVQEGMILSVECFANGEIVTPVVVVHKQGDRLIDQIPGVIFRFPVEINQRTVGIPQDVALVTGVHEYRCATHKRLNQAVSFWQMRLQCVHDAAFAAHPYQRCTG